MENTRRSFLKKMTVAGLGTAGLALNGNAAASTVVTDAPESKKKKPAGKDDGKLRFGFIGTGSRCHEHINNVLSIDGNKIVAICDIQQGPIERTLKHIANFNVPAPKVYTGSDRAFEQMLNNEEFDCVIIASPWEWHVPMSVAAMKAGVPYVGVEVSAANSLEECWDLVNVSEATGSHLNIMENVCYRRDVMAALRMVREGLFGEILHCRCGYEHDLREVKFNDGQHYNYVPGSGDLRMGPTAFAEAQWRTNHSVRRNGDIYPTHGAGPVAHCVNINRGNRFISLTSMATQTRGLHKFIVDNGGENHPLAKVRFNLGDIVTTQIKCANGETILVTHDTNSPRPYSLGFRVQGTEGLWMNDGDNVYIQGKSKPHRWDNSEEWFKKYDHKLWSSLEARAAEAGHGGMDFIMMYDLIDCIRNKKPAPMDCYDAAAWSAISPLSEMSIARGGALVDFPDFTRGQWIHRQDAFAL
ncbi:Gfo/Idh/MocA family protein [Parabacteroides pacaensis]|uniref:Gfo/Idh/MocA family protein n=1 Tax=Parabacteroides pacaensis TaxID=2086575 RepID=UPI000D102BFB|nr:Gfo/Idh/MocA family oxidoreductase [Parabacteroides pacaensis]